MRLLHTETLKLEEFHPDKIPDSYAILSHRWEEEEVTFKDMMKSTAKDKKGYPKIVDCCKKARDDGFKYVWIDTCCIDKQSSAELSEAINSMFAWYRNSHLCYAYLSDVPNNSKDHREADSPFRKSKWFTRGWTLQELLAPWHVSFLDQSWHFIGNRLTLSRTISEIQGISCYNLTFFNYASVAQKMSWMSNRQTTRIEDLAYCMLGIFGVNLPPLYGEGQNAFLRLQLEIMKISDDESIFAWNATLKNAAKYPERSLLASSPSEFRDCGQVVPHSFSQRPAYSMTNKGLQITLPAIEINAQKQPGELGLFKVALNCKLNATENALGIFVMRSNSKNHASTVVARVFSDCWASTEQEHRYAAHPEGHNAALAPGYGDRQISMFVPGQRNLHKAETYIKAWVPSDLRRFYVTVIFLEQPASGTWIDTGNGYYRIRVSNRTKTWFALVFSSAAATCQDSPSCVTTSHILGIVAMHQWKIGVRLKSIPVNDDSDLQNLDQAVAGLSIADEDRNWTRAPRKHVFDKISQDVAASGWYAAQQRTHLFVPDWDKTLHMQN